MRKFVVCSILSLSTILTGCGGHTPHPVAAYQPDDNYLTCSQLERSIEHNQQEMYKLYPKTRKTGKNVALAVTGYFLIVPLFFMDFSNSEEIEINAFQQRDQHLHFLAERKGCDKMPPKIILKTKADKKKTA